MTRLRQVKILALGITAAVILSIGTTTEAQGAAEGSPPAGETLPEVQFSGEGVTVSRVTPEGAVAVLSVTRQINSSGATDVVVQDVLLEDDDGDGTVTLPLGEVTSPPPPLSVWLVVDVASGATTLAWPGGFEPTEVDAELTEEPGDGAPGRVRVPLRRAELLWVHRGTETPARVLRATLGDGAAEDADGARDGGVTVGPRVFARAVGRSGEPGPPAEPPGRFQPNDLLLAIDAGSLEVSTLRLPGPPTDPGAGQGGGNGTGTGGEG